MTAITKNHESLINEVAQRVYEIAASKGFHDDERTPNRVAQYCANLTGEVSELWEANRRGKLWSQCDKNTSEPLSCAAEELADIVIRAMDMAAALGVNLGHSIAVKSAYNETRERMHGKTC